MLLPWLKFSAILYKASDAGQLTQRNGSFYWPAHGTCTAPIYRDFKSAPRGEVFYKPQRFVKINGVPEPLWPVDDFKFTTGDYQGGDARPFFLDVSVKCRKCPACLRYRRKLWMARAMSETEWAAQNMCRTWFITFTLSARSRARAPWDARMMKKAFRLFTIAARKKVKFRYLLAVEYHKDGTPHLHALIHEMDPLKPITKRVLSSFWKLGFAHVKLVSHTRKAGSYVSKYMSKDMETGRVPCSLGYGRPSGKVKRENGIAQQVRQYLD